MMSETYAEINVSVHQRVLVVTVVGAVDLESLQMAFGNIEKQVDLLVSPWATLVDLRKWDLYTEEMIEPLAKFQLWLMEQGHKVEISVTGGSPLKQQARDALWNHLKVAPDHKYVLTPEEGWQWLIREGYCEVAPS